MVDVPAGAELEQPSSGRRPNLRGGRLVVLALVVAALVILIVQNAQKVSVRFLFFTGHLRLIWVILICVVLAGAVGYVSGARGTRRRRRRRRSG
ncbi:MAG: LapA family protein [Acidimicrobiales bacterium]